MAPHAGYIIASYLVTVLALAALVGWIVFDGRTLKRRLAELEARGVRRRSAGNPS